MKNGTATCPFCGAVNWFGENEIHCQHYKTFGYEEWDEFICEDRPYAVFCEDERKVLIEEENNE
jgi:hypothetical protein